VFEEMYELLEKRGTTLTKMEAGLAIDCMLAVLFGFSLSLSILISVPPAREF